MNKKAIVLFSGGQDSTTCLFWSFKHFEQVIAISFDYGQRHAIELQQAQKITQILEIEHHILTAPALKEIGKTALTSFDEIQIAEKTQLPNTFVPGRNLIFLGLAAGWGYLHEVYNLVTGVCQTDYSGYPDCRYTFIQSAEQTLQLALDLPHLKIHTPLMFLNKAQIWKVSHELGALDFIVENTHTCYKGERKLKHAWGYGCGECPACELRKKGFEEAFGYC
ncbi:MAG: 7-cyano-7-deazaguanine synthase QueC [Candidatus Bathyarchaeota archaeon]|nr:7-cyano-7-deazaguanine synthase QueC [Candidatus Bathyarchaeota archaeon]